MGNKYITFGEIMLRISPSSKGNRVFQTEDFRIEPGGSESNVAVALANLGCDVRFATFLPDNILKYIILRYLNKYGVDTEKIVISGKKIGSYWTENGVSVRASEVIYDRENSSFFNSGYDDYDWEEIFKDGKWFHVSGITAALNKNKSEMLSKVMKQSKSKKLINSIDLNYRNTLWNWVEGKAQIYQVYNELCSYADLILGNETDYYDCLGIDRKEKNKESENKKEICCSEYKTTVEPVFRSFKNLKYIAISFRDSLSASENKWRGVLAVGVDNKINIYESKEHTITDIVDRVGAGDSFSAGIIFGLNEFNDDYQKIIDFAIAFSCLKHSIRGDACEFFKDDVLHFIETGGTGRIIR
jgi:2-dehydro-3-deoxygluconokinase